MFNRLTVFELINSINASPDIIVTVNAYTTEKITLYTGMYDNIPDNLLKKPVNYFNVTRLEDKGYRISVLELTAIIEL